MLAIKQARAKPITITSVYFFKDIVSISLPAHIIVIALITVAIEYRLPNSVLVRLKACLKSLLNKEIKNVCPGPEQRAIKNPNKSKLKFLRIKLIKINRIL